MSDLSPKKAAFTDILNQADAILNTTLTGVEQDKPETLAVYTEEDQAVYDVESSGEAAEIASEEPPRLHLLAAHASGVVENMRSQRDVITTRRSHKQLLSGALKALKVRRIVIEGKLKEW